MKFPAIIGLCLTLLFSAVTNAEDIELNPSHPKRYTVVKGDTLWDISAKFLKSPWQWTEIWEKNPQIDNPHLIFPGDVVALRYVNGKPVLTVQRNNGMDTNNDAKLSPYIRYSPVDKAIPAIPIDAIKQFLSKPKVVTQNELKIAPYIVDFADDHVVGGAGYRIYVRSIIDGSSFTVFRPGQIYKDSETGEILGYEALYIGDASLQQAGDPATLLLNKTTRETVIGDRLLPISEEKIQLNYFPHAPKSDIKGKIIGVLDGVSQIGQYNIVVIDRGIDDGIEIGHILEIYQTGKTIRDIISDSFLEEVKLPNEKAGMLMVFRTFERVSYALVMKATAPLHTMDTVQSP